MRDTLRRTEPQPAIVVFPQTQEHVLIQVVTQVRGEPEIAHQYGPDQLTEAGHEMVRGLDLSRDQAIDEDAIRNMERVGHLPRW